ncbi:MAG: hypothetical protein JNK49_02960 [Planctomycetes bacterium]|nr:hypothetical protein [Planctomycetota bacterium]
MPTPLASFALCLLPFLPCPPRPDELRLDDGRVLVGAVTARGDLLEVQTRDGTVVVAKARVKSHRTDDELRAELRRDEQNGPPGAFLDLQLAARARAYGLDAELWRHLDRAVPALQAAEATATASGAALQRRLADLLGQLEPELLPQRLRSAKPAARIQALLQAVRPGLGVGKSAALAELLVREPNADGELRRLARGQAQSQAQRLFALRVLQRRSAPGNDRFVLRSAVLDDSAEVRSGAIELVRSAGAADPAAVACLAPGLTHAEGELRIRTAEALGSLGHADAVKLLVLAGPNAGKAVGDADPVLRSHVAFLDQQSYVRDFDVEVAQGTAIGSPRVGLLQSGVVLDAAVPMVFEIVRSYRRALHTLTGADPGGDPRLWAHWLANLPTPAPTPAAAQPARRR